MHRIKGRVFVCHACGTPVDPQILMEVDEKASIQSGYVATTPGFIEFTCSGCQTTYIFDRKFLEAKINYARSLKR